MEDRLKEELDLLQNRWPELTYKENGRWVLLPEYPIPDTIKQDAAAVCFRVKSNYPQRAPYGFYVRKPIELESGLSFNNVKNTNKPPFDGDWLQFSWKPADWRPGPTVDSGTNLVDWSHSFHKRLKQGR